MDWTDNDLGRGSISGCAAVNTQNGCVTSTASITGSEVTIPTKTRWQLGTNIFDFEAGTAAAVATILGIGDRAIAAAMGETLRQIDERADYESMKTIVEYLTEHPEHGLIDAGDDRLAAVSTWRLRRAHPETTNAWERAATEASRNANRD